MTNRVIVAIENGAATAVSDVKAEVMIIDLDNIKSAGDIPFLSSSDQVLLKRQAPDLLARLEIARKESVFSLNLGQRPISDDQFIGDACNVWIECYVFARMLKRTFPVPSNVRAEYVVAPTSLSNPDCQDFQVELRCVRDTLESYQFVESVIHHCAKDIWWDEEAHYELIWFERKQAYDHFQKAGEMTISQVPIAYKSQHPASHRIDQGASVLAKFRAQTASVMREAITTSV